MQERPVPKVRINAHVLMVRNYGSIDVIQWKCKVCDFVNWRGWEPTSWRDGRNDQCDACQTESFIFPPESFILSQKKI